MATVPPSLPSDSADAPITELVVMADYGACLWDQDGSACWVGEVGGSEALEQRINAWEQYFWLQRDDPEKFDLTYLNAEGRLIASEIKALVGTDIRVLHRDFHHNLFLIEQ